jgi:hypothetical protein
MSEEQLIAEANATFQRGQEALADGDWEAYGESQARLEALLGLLTGGGGATPVATPEGTR